MNKLEILGEIKAFLDGYNTDLKYLVNVETHPDSNFAECVIHEPGKDKIIKKVEFQPFMYMKDLTLEGMKLYASDQMIYPNKLKQYGITITPLKTGNQKRLKHGYCYKLTSSKSYNCIINFLKDGKIYPYEKARDEAGNIVKDEKDEPIYLYKDMFYSPRLYEQFFISTQSRLYKGIEEYKDVHKVVFDIETTGLRHQRSRVFAIGVMDNRGFKIILEAEKLDDNDAEIKLIQDFFNLISILQPAIICGYNSEDFDFQYLLGRAEELKMDLSKIPTSLRNDIGIKRKPNTSVKYGNTADKFTATEMWGYSVIDIIHASKRTAAVNTELKATGLKYVSKFEKIAKPNRTYIPGEDLSIGRYYAENNIFLIDENNNYLNVPGEYQATARKLFKLQLNKPNYSDDEYKSIKTQYLKESPEFVTWFRLEALPNKLTTFITGKNLVKNYLLDDLWETEQVDELYNQSSFMLAKIVPTNYQKICTMGTAAIWNLLLTAWSYENDIAIPYCEKKEGFSGGLARCYKTGYSEKIVKIDYASLYPMLQLTWDIFPMFDITGVIKKILLYLTTTRNIYKKLANKDRLNEEELMLLEKIDADVYRKLLLDKITDADRAMFKIKQLPVKILNNSLFGALGSGVAFNWSDSICAARITCCGRLELRHAISWFRKYGCMALLAVTDGINFQIPEKTTIEVSNEGITEGLSEGLITEMWRYNDKRGISALIEKFNDEEMLKPYMSVDNDGEYISCLNLSRINYSTLSLVKDKKTGEMKEKIKLTGNTIKSKVMPGYIEEFIQEGLNLIHHGKGKEFIAYYNNYVQDICLKQIPLKKIATKNRVKLSLSGYIKRGKDKNGRDKAKQAHMELLVEKRNKIAEELFQKHKDTLTFTKAEEALKIEDKLKLVATYMPQEPQLDSVVYQVNTGYLKSHSSSGKIIDPKTGEERYASALITAEDLQENPNMLGEYNVVKYLDAFNSRVKSLLVGFDEDVQKTLLAKYVKKTTVDEFGNKKTGKELSVKDYEPYKLELRNFDSDDYDESMYLEPKEVIFWNRTGYDPRLVWNGFKMHDDDMVYYEIYESALNYLNEKMTAANKTKIKSINDKYEKGDLVLVKDGQQYNLGLYNGVYLEIIKESIEIPKTQVEIEIDKKKAELDAKIASLQPAGVETERDKYLKALAEKKLVYFSEFKKQFNLPTEITMDKLFAEAPAAKGAFEKYIEDVEASQEEEVMEFGFDDGGDGPE